MNQRKPISAKSSILKLNPFLDKRRILRVGGRLNKAERCLEANNPVLIAGKSTVANLLVHHLMIHEQGQHQGRYFTEGAIRSHGFRITGAKRLSSTVLYKCVKCRKLKGKQEHQKMADLPIDRVTPAPPFSSVSVDTFRPWTVVTRKTRGGQAHNKRWAIIFTCLTTRGIHIEMIEDMSSSSFIHALRRFISLRGPVKEFRSDRGTNFVGATDGLRINRVNVEDGQISNFLYNTDTI